MTWPTSAWHSDRRRHGARSLLGGHDGRHALAIALAPKRFSGGPKGHVRRRRRQVGHSLPQLVGVGSLPLLARPAHPARGAATLSRRGRERTTMAKHQRPPRTRGLSRRVLWRHWRARAAAAAAAPAADGDRPSAAAGGLRRHSETGGPGPLTRTRARRCGSPAAGFPSGCEACFTARGMRAVAASEQAGNKPGTGWCGPDKRRRKEAENRPGHPSN